MSDLRDTDYCVATSKRSGKQCRRYPIPGGTVCASHGGKAPQVIAAARRRLALAEARGLIDEYGIEVQTTPEEALLASVWEAAGNVALLRKLISGLDAKVDPKTGIAGPTGSTSKLHEAAPHVFVTMYDAERDRLVRFAKACADAGVQERLVTIAEGQAQLMVQAFDATLAELGIEDQTAARQAFGRHLKLVS